MSIRKPFASVYLIVTIAFALGFYPVSCLRDFCKMLGISVKESTAKKKKKSLECGVRSRASLGCTGKSPPAFIPWSINVGSTALLTFNSSYIIVCDMCSSSVWSFAQPAGNHHRREPDFVRVECLDQGARLCQSGVSGPRTPTLSEWSNWTRESDFVRVECLNQGVIQTSEFI